MRILTPGELPILDHAEPMVVTAKMAAAVTYYGDGLHLDGPLSWGAYLEWVEEHDPTSLPPISSGSVVDFELPLAAWMAPTIGDPDPAIVLPDGQVWGWCCSAAQAEWRCPGKREVRKRPVLSEMVRWTAATSENYGTGPRKARDLAYPTMLATEIRWYAMGDLARVRDLLSRVSAIGKLSHHGSGQVLRWEAEACEHDWSIWQGARLMRRLPATDELTDAGRTATYGAIRAPYHHPSREVLCCGPDDYPQP